MLKVGDKLIYLPRDSRQKEAEVIVSKVGRKWAQLEPSYYGRADKETGWVDGGRYLSPARVMTDAALRNEQYRAIQWGIIKDAVLYKRSPPNWLTNEDLDKVAAILSDLDGQIEEDRRSDDPSPRAGQEPDTNEI